MKSVSKNVLILLIFCMVFLLGACDQVNELLKAKAETEQDGESSTQIITGPVVIQDSQVTLSGAVYTYSFQSKSFSRYSLSAIYAYWDEWVEAEDQTLEHLWVTGSVNHLNNTFTITLSSPPTEKLKTLSFPEGAEVTLTNPTVKVLTDIILSTNDTGHDFPNEVVLVIPNNVESDKKYTVTYYSLLYSNGDCTINGTFTMIDEEGNELEEITTTFENFSIKAGWNIIKVIQTIDHTLTESMKKSEIVSTVTTIPSDAVWCIGSF